MQIKNIRLGLLGFGNVLRAFAELLPEKTAIIQQRYGIAFSVVGIATGSRGIVITPKGIDLKAALKAHDLRRLGEPVKDSLEFVTTCPADIILEATPVNPKTGQPAAAYLRAALRSGKHVVTANKGPVAFAHKELKALAVEKDLGFFFESTVMDGVPIHALGREGLLASEFTHIRGVLNSTTNSILTRMEQGMSFQTALAEMQEAGVAETDPSHDVDGWDAAIKIAILANTLMGGDLRPVDVNPIGIRTVTPEDILAAAQENCRIKLVCEAAKDPNGQVRASVKPMKLQRDDPLARLESTASAVTFTTDTLKSITIIESPASPRATAYGMLVDAINIARGRR